MDASDLAFAGLARQAELLRAREISAPELTQLCLSRIDALDPRLNAFRVVLGEQAMAQAARAQERLQAGERAPLLGVPVAVKDNVDVAGELTTHGTGSVTEPAGADAEVVRRLRAAGAIVVGKTNMSELAAWGHMTETAAWGVTRNPWAPERSPGGSSGGSAVAVAAGLVPAALGSDGGGSIRVPSAFCGLFGLKPQRGRVSLAPEAQHWHGLTVFGGIARSVLDAAVFDDAIMGPAEGDRHRPPAPAVSFAEAVQREPGPLRIAVSTRSPLPARVGAEARGAVESTAELLGALGHEVGDAHPRYGELSSEELPRYLAGVHADAARLQEPARLEPRTRALARLGARLRGRPLACSLAREEKVAARIGALFASHDVLLTPVTDRQPPPADRWRGRGALVSFEGMRPYICYTAVWNHTGQPARPCPPALTRTACRSRFSSSAGRTRRPPCSPSRRSSRQRDRGRSDARGCRGGCAELT